MGETGVSAGDRRASFSFNPALLSSDNSRSLIMAHHRWLQDTKLNFLQVNFVSYVGIGVSILSTGVEDIEVRSVPSPQPQALIASHDLAFALTLARKIDPSLQFGVNIKYIYEHILNEDTDGFALDLGGIYYPIKNLIFGVSLLNLGQMNSMLSEKPELPLTARIGTAYEIHLKHVGKLLLAGEINYVKNEDMRGNFGVEWKPIEIIALRFGYLLYYDERSYTLGLGLNWKRFSFDYAYVPFTADLGNTQRFGLMVEF
jgi:hypothetical protein